MRKILTAIDAAGYIIKGASATFLIMLYATAPAHQFIVKK